jgi:hypothetical protein
MGYHLTTSFDLPPARSHASPKTHTPLPRLQERGLRFYSATLGRWHSRDPIAETGHRVLKSERDQASGRSERPTRVWANHEPASTTVGMDAESELTERAYEVNTFVRNSPLNAVDWYGEDYRIHHTTAIGLPVGRLHLVLEVQNPDGNSSKLYEFIPIQSGPWRDTSLRVFYLYIMSGRWVPGVWVEEQSVDPQITTTDPWVKTCPCVDRALIGNFGGVLNELDTYSYNLWQHNSNTAVRRRLAYVLGNLPSGCPRP